MFKKIARRIILTISWSLARAYVRRTKPVIIGVVGSVGKTGTKRAIASILATKKRVAWQDGNYNDLVTVPLVFFGLHQPSLFNPFAWAAAHAQMIKALLSGTGPEVVVLELGTDTPGDIAEFGKYLQLDIAVVTAISHEHMEFFGTLAAVAEEELAVIDYSQKVYVADQAMTFIPNRPDNLYTYGDSKDDDVWFSSQGESLKLRTSAGTTSVKPQLKGQHQYAALCIAAEIAAQLQLTPEQIATAAETLGSMPGRMNVLAGKDGAVLIDDTYNSSPTAVVKALDYLYSLPQRRKIAVLGNMNEMGKHSLELHREVAKACDPQKLELVITIGPDANNVLAPAARELGCKVEQFDSPYAIGEYLAQQKLAGTAILFKGSQNKVYLEEAVKLVLADPDDQKQLVRQSSTWLKTKAKQFKV